MRFITEFELSSPFEIINYKGLRERGSAEWLGLDIAKAFGWEKKDGIIPDNPTAERHALEIEAFPMDKWIEFKQKLASLFRNDDYAGNGFEDISNLIKELESFGKPAGAAKQQDNG